MSEFEFGGGVGSIASSLLPDSSQDISDLVTQTTAIPITAASVLTPLTNDGLAGNLVQVYGAITTLYDTATQALVFGAMQLGDRVDFRLDLTLVTATTNTDLEVGLAGGLDGPAPFTLPFYTRQIKKSGANRLVVTGWMTMDYASTIANPAKFYVATDGIGTDTCIVHGWKIYHTPRIRL